MSSRCVVGLVVPFVLVCLLGCDDRQGLRILDYPGDGGLQLAVTSIYAIQSGSVQLEDPVLVKNVIVTTEMVRTSSGSTSLDGFWVIESESGPYSGIFVMTDGIQVMVKPGDVVDLRGVYKEFFQSSQIVASQVDLVGQADIPAPIEVTTADVYTGSSSAEQYEHVLINLKDVVVSSADLGYGDFGVQPQQGGPELIVSPRFDTQYDYDPKQGDLFSKMAGVLDYSYSQFRLQPRFCADLIGEQDQAVCEDKFCPSPTTIAQIQNREAEDAVSEGCMVRLENVIVTSQVFETSGQPSFFVQEAQGGAFGGIFVYARGLDLDEAIQPGSQVTLEGKYVEFYESSQIEAVSVQWLGQSTVPEPTLVTPVDVNDTGVLAEAYESVLVKVENVVTRQANYSSSTTDYGDFSVASLLDTESELIVSNLFDPGFACPAAEDGTPCPTDQRKQGQRFSSLVGILTYSFYHFRLQPRDLADLNLIEPSADDPDGDGFDNQADNCPDIFNPQQDDFDQDGLGDACDNCGEVANASQDDTDLDGWGDACDNCPSLANPSQSDQDLDNLGDDCDPDIDGDGVLQGSGNNPCAAGQNTDCDDNCPYSGNADQADENGNGIGDVCDRNTHLMISEVCLSPTGGEFVEIHNPTQTPIALANYYLWDSTHFATSTFYWLLATFVDRTWTSSDFLVRFPAQAVIGVGEYQTIAINTLANYTSEYGFEPDYLVRADGSPSQNMRPGIGSSVGSDPTLSNAGEVVVLFFWDGQSDLVVDIDYLVWADDFENFDEYTDKTDVTVGSSPFLPDTPQAEQDFLSGHSAGKSFQRIDLDEGTEKKQGGNGLVGHDETSEDVSNTFTVSDPTPGLATAE